MRLWSIDPHYIDSKGLIALWREALGAQANLIAIAEDRKIGYNNHPQLKRFLAHPRPVDALAAYMQAVYDESIKRRYSFDLNKIKGDRKYAQADDFQHILVTTGQLQYERQHLYYKLQKRDPSRVMELISTQLTWHPSFAVIHGDIEVWERSVDYTKEEANE